MPSEAVMLGAIALGVVVLTVAAYGVLSLFLSAPATPEPGGLVEAAALLREPDGTGEKLDRAFGRAVRGSRLGLTSERAVEVALVVGLGLALAAFLAFGHWEFAALALPLGMILTVIGFALLGGRERKALQEQLPDGLFQLSRSLRSGQSLEQAFRTSAEYNPQPLQGTFRRVAGRLEMGLTPDLALAATADEVALTDFDALASVVALTSRAGGKLPQLLDRLAAAVRDRNQFRGYYQTVTGLSVLTTGFVALAAPVAAVAYLIFAPELFQNFFQSRTGLGLFAAAVLLEVIGVAWMLWLVSRARHAY